MHDVLGLPQEPDVPIPEEREVVLAPLLVKQHDFFLRFGGDLCVKTVRVLLLLEGSGGERISIGTVILNKALLTCGCVLGVMMLVGESGLTLPLHQRSDYERLQTVTL